MQPRRYTKFILAGLVVVCLAGARWFERRLDGQRLTLGLSATAAVPQGAPPMLAFTTVALGGFRGLIANVLWIRANQLQQDEKYFEMVQLANWITQLQPRLKQVWIHLAWNMAFNISVKFSDHEDRWRWVMRGVELLRDEALRYNPDEVDIYRELAWLFFFKLGQNLDDAQMLYKQHWLEEMTAVLGPQRDSYRELLNPQTDAARARLKLLREKYKMDPKRMAQADEQYGPLEWRLPETQAIYWTLVGMEKCRGKDVALLRRTLYQPMKLAFERGRIVANRAGQPPMLGPNLDMIPRANACYEQMIAEDAKGPSNSSYKTAQRNFLRQAVFYLYTHNRLAEAARWFKYLRTKFPEDQQAKEAGDAETFALQQVTEGVGGLDRNKTISLIEGFLRTGFIYLAMDNDDNGQGVLLLARKLWVSYQGRVSPDQMGRIGLPEFGELRQSVLKDLFDAEKGLTLELQGILRTKLEALGLAVPAPAPVPSSKSGGKP